MCNFQRIKSIRHLLDQSSCTDLCVSLCPSHLDYTNAILYGLPEVSLNKFQREQNACARLCVSRGKDISSIQCMYELHWLPVKYRIKFKILVLTYNCLKGDAPQYLRNLLTELMPSHEGLRSGKSSRLLIPKTKCKMFASRSFSVAGPTLRNSLPEDIKNAKTVVNFTKQLKTHLFRKAYS